MSQPDKMAPLIRSLCDAEIARREKSAAEIFRLGSETARSAAAKWLADPDLASLFVIHDSQFPETTVGLAVEPENFERIRSANGSPRLADVPPDQDAREFELHFPRGVQLDILTTQQKDGTGAIARYLKKFGEGIQQIELLTRDVDRATEILRERFHIEPVYPVTRAGADGTRVNFFLASAPTGKKVLIELVEAAAHSKPE
ncbi:MAG: hypothetical protein WB780_01145 [Candidatus Acidiferrales bacterium]